MVLQLIGYVCTALVALFALCALCVMLFRKLPLIPASWQFNSGGVLVNFGYAMQDPFGSFTLCGNEPTAQEVLEAFLNRNRQSSTVRHYFPRTRRHPRVAVVVCMDGRVRISELVGDTRGYYYVLRNAGGLIGPVEVDDLVLAVNNGVQVIVITDHDDCAARKTAADPTKQREYPALCAAIAGREAGIRMLLAHPTIQAKIRSGELIVRWMDLETSTERLLPHPGAEAVVPEGCACTHAAAAG